MDPPLWCTDPLGVENPSGIGIIPFVTRMLTMPFKLNQDRRHHIPRQRHKVTNWPDCEASLRQRGSLTVWFTDDVLDHVAQHCAWLSCPAVRDSRGTRPGRAGH
jgi:hypothetical protein